MLPILKIIREKKKLKVEMEAKDMREVHKM